MTEVTNSLTDGIAVVTGAGGGLGRALSVELVRRGVFVAGIGRREATLAETARLVEASELFLPIAADVADKGAVKHAFTVIDQQTRPLKILINNAAVHDRFDFLAEDPDRLMGSVKINLGGMVYCSWEALQRMVQSGVGRIVNVTTFADLAPLSGSSAYSVSKGAGRILTRAIVADTVDRFPDIVISDWIPGALATQMGVADGILPEDAAKWGANLALMNDSSLCGSLFDRNLEVRPPRSKKQLLKDLMTMKRRQPRRQL